MTRGIKAIIYTAAAVLAVVLFIGGQKLSFEMLRYVSSVTSIVVLLSIAFEMWLWKWPLLNKLAKRPVIEGTWKVDLRSNWKDVDGKTIPPVEGYAVIRQTLLNLSLRLHTKESSSQLVGTEIICSTDGLYCVSGIYRNEPEFQERHHSAMHYGAIWLQVVEKPIQLIKGHYWTDRNTAGQMTLTDKRSEKFQDFNSAKEYFAAH